MYLRENSGLHFSDGEITQLASFQMVLEYRSLRQSIWQISHIPPYVHVRQNWELFYNYSLFCVIHRFQNERDGDILEKNKQNLLSRS